MKEIRFFLQDIAELRSVSSIGQLSYYHPITSIDDDLELNTLDNIITIRSLKWRGTFTQFRTFFEEKIKHEFFYPHHPLLTETSAKKLKIILKWTKDALVARDQLIKNLGFSYFAGFGLIHKCSLEAWIDETHPYFDRSANNLNMIMRYEIDLQDDHDSSLNYYKKNLMQSLTESDLLGVAKIKMIFSPEFSCEQFSK
jgi:hypothetical protein